MTKILWDLVCHNVEYDLIVIGSGSIWGKDLIVLLYLTFSFPLSISPVSLFPSLTHFSLSIFLFPSLYRSSLSFSVL